MTTSTFVIFFAVCALLGFGVMMLLDRLNRSLHETRLNLCLTHLNQARELAELKNPKYASEIRRHVDQLRARCQQWGFEAEELGTDADEMAQMLNSVSSFPPSPDNLTSIDIGCAEDEAYTSLDVSEIIHSVASDPMNVEGTYELDLEDLEEMKFEPVKQ